MPSFPARSRPNKQLTVFAVGFLAVLAIKIFQSAGCFDSATLAAQGRRYVDFDVFHLVGRMILHGSVNSAYDMARMFSAEAAESGVNTQMPWTYPPQFDLFVALLALVGKGTAYILFTGTTFAAYVWVLRRLAGPNFAPVVILTMPALTVCVIIGQNGLLTGALVGAFAIASLRGRAIGGLPLGLMVVKPHLAVALTVMALARHSWAVLAVATAVTLATAGLSTIVLGPGIWAAFLDGVHASGAFLKEGNYPLYRMTSLYACARTFGVPSDTALALQAALALAACSATVYANVKRFSPHLQVGIAVLCTLAISPYNYDYDMPILGVAAALLSADVIARSTMPERVALLALGWVTSGWWLVAITISGDQPSSYNQDHLITLSGLAYPIFVGMILRILRRAAAPAPLPLPEPLAQAA